MPPRRPRPLLKGKNGLIVSVASDQSIAWCCAKAFGELVNIMDAGFTRAFLATPYARQLTGTTVHLDGGVNIMA